MVNTCNWQIINKTGDLRELRAEDLKMFKSTQEVLPLSLKKT
jgi:hypothetical protein